MERNANYALVGLTSALLVVGLVVFSVWLAAYRFNQDYDYYDIVFAGPVRGLSPGGEVQFNGIRVGEVTGISLDTVDPTQVIARAKVTSGVPIRVDSVAMLEPQGITGVNYVQITAGTPAQQLLRRAVPKGTVPRIRSERGLLSDLLDSGGHVLARAIEALDRVNRVLSEDNIKRIGGMLDDVQAATAELRERKAIVADAQRALQSMDHAAQQVGQLAASSNALVNDDGRQIVAKLGNAASDIEAAASDLRTLMDRSEGPAGDFATTGLQQITTAGASLQQAADSLDRILGEIQQSPQGLFNKPPAREIEVQP